MRESHASKMDSYSKNQESLVNLSLFESIRQTQPGTFYLDYFVLLMLSLLPKKNEITTIDIQKLFSKKLLLDIPLRTVNKISDRAVKKGYLKQLNAEKQNRKYSLSTKKIQNQNKKFNELKNRIRASQNQFYKKLKIFIFKKYYISLDLSKCEELFETHFLKNYKDIHNIEYPKLENIYNEDYVMILFFNYIKIRMKSF